MADEDVVVSADLASDEPQGVVDDVVKGCFGTLLIFGSALAGLMILTIFLVKLN